MIAYLPQSKNPDNKNLPPECPWTSWVYRSGQPIPEGTKILSEEDFNSLYEKYRLDIQKEEELITNNGLSYKIESNLIPITHSFVTNNVLTVVKNPRIHNAKYQTKESSITLHVTHDGTINGIPLFNDLEDCGIQVSTRTVNVINGESPWCYIESVMANSIVVRIKKTNSGNILIGGYYQGNIDNNLNVNLYLQITGLSA